MAFDSTQDTILGQSTFMAFTNSQLILIATHEVNNSSWARIRIVLNSVLLSKGINPRFGCYTPNLLMAVWHQHLLCRKIVQLISRGVSLGNCLSRNSTLVLHPLFAFPIDAHLWKKLLNNQSLASTCIPCVRIKFCPFVWQTPCKQCGVTHPLALTPRTRWCGTGDSAPEVPKTLLGKLALPPQAA